MLGQRRFFDEARGLDDKGVTLLWFLFFSYREELLSQTETAVAAAVRRNVAVAVRDAAAPRIAVPAAATQHTERSR